MSDQRLYIVGYVSQVLNTILGIYWTLEDAEEALKRYSKTYGVDSDSNWNHGLYITAAYLYPNSQSQQK